MGMSISCTSGIGQHLEGLAKRWIGRAATAGVSEKPLGEYVDGRTTTAATRKRRGPVVLEGWTGGIACTVTVGHHGEVEVLLEGLPECLIGTRPFLSFPAAASAAGIAWAPGPRAGIVHVGEEVSATRQLRCLVARSRSRIGELPCFLSSLCLMSEEGESQPLCVIGIGLRLRNR